MQQSFDCPNCQASLDYDAESEALTVRCPYCSSTVIVPDSLRKRSSRGSRQPEGLAQVVQLVQNGRKIEAIKLFRETFNVGLKEAKEVVEAIERHEDIHLGGTNFHTESVSVTSYTGTPTVRTTSGGAGCAIFIALLIVGLGAAGIFFFLNSSTDSLNTARIIEEVQSAVESGSENSSQETSITIVTTIEAAFPNQDIEGLINIPGVENQGATDDEPGFAEVIMQVGGEEGVGPGFFNDTRRLAVDGEGNIYTGDYSGGRIQVFNENGDFLTTWNAGEDLYMTGMTVDRNGTVYIIKTSGIEKYNGMTGELLGTVSIPGARGSDFRTAGTGPDGNVYLVGEERLIRLDNNGNINLDISEPFANISNFDVLRFDVAIDGAGNIILLGNEAIYKLDANGNFIDQFGSKGEAEDQFFTSPTALAVDGKGRIFVNDFFGIKVYEGNGRYIAMIDSPGVAFDMLVTDENDLLVMDRNGNEIRKYQLNQ